MGACFSMSKEEAEAAKRSRKVEKMMQEQARIDSETVKLLILGAGESGKSTLFKQMKVLYGKSASDSDRHAITNVIHCNVIQSMQIMLGQLDSRLEKSQLQLESLNDGDEDTAKERSSFNVDVVVKLDDEECIEAAKRVRALRMYDRLNSVSAKDMDLLWNTASIQAMFDLRHTYQLPDSTKYYMEKLDEITDPNYLPSNEDMLRARVRTSGIVEEKYVIDGVKFSMYDVGGQRNERKKWIHCFENVTGKFLTKKFKNCTQKYVNRIYFCF
tara:strand:+ start:143 stop:955 length:813 start_codon:yes stop_codon:yes gene_type:complete